MEIGLLWGVLVVLLITSIGILAWEVRKPPGEYKVILLFLRNSEEISEAMLRQLCSRARRHKEETRILVIDDHSSDLTAAIVQRMVRRFPEAELLDRKGKQDISPAQWGALLQNILAVFDFRDSPESASLFL